MSDWFQAFKEECQKHDATKVAWEADHTALEEMRQLPEGYTACTEGCNYYDGGGHHWRCVVGPLWVRAEDYPPAKDPERTGRDYFDRMKHGDALGVLEDDR